jgi:class 3 adenylate cyclase
MTARREKLAILFADISGSTALYEKLGDDLARRLISRCLSIMSSSITTYRGTLVKTLGDVFMCTFPSAESAFRAACEMQLAIKSDSSHSEHPLYIRIGFHYGEVLCEEGDFYGDAVNVAARVTAITRTNQIMTTAAAVDALPRELQEKSRKILRAEFKGKQEQLDIFQVSWERDDVESTRIGIPAYRKNGGTDQMTLRYHGASHLVNDLHRSLLLGRDASCQLVVKNDFASRQHAHVELRLGKFILTDHSSNGTYIRFASGQVVRINREEAVLVGNGSISLGQSYADDPTELIEFSIPSRSEQSA